MSRVTIKDIATQANISKTAVSFAFNSPEKLPEETVNRILKIADELGYRPDPVARSMSTKQTGTIGLLVPQPIPNMVRNPFFSELLEGIGEVCEKGGYSLMLVPPLKGSMSQAISTAMVDGFLTLGLEAFRDSMRVLQQRHVPFVMIDSDPVENIPCVNIDDTQGAYEAMSFVLQMGHRSIAIMGIRSGLKGHYKEYKGILQRRMSGYLKALAEFNLSMRNRDIHLVECNATLKGGKAGFSRVWQYKHKPTAIVAMSDIIAIGAIEAAKNLKIAIPQELSVIGFDNVPAARWLTPSLTTVHQPLREKGQLAAKLLDELLNKRVIENSYELPTELIKRDSVSKLSGVRN